MAWFKTKNEFTERPDSSGPKYTDEDVKRIEKDAFERGKGEVPDVNDIIDARLTKMEKVVDALIDKLGKPEDYVESDIGD